MVDAKKIGKRISEKRKEIGMSQKTLAVKLNLTDKTISKWESGKGLPSIEALVELCDIFGISVDEILK